VLTVNSRFSINKTFTSSTLHWVHLPCTSINSRSRCLHPVRVARALARGLKYFYFILYANNTFGRCSNECLQQQLRTDSNHRNIVWHFTKNPRTIILYSLILWSLSIRYININIWW
jgi:hypothetical protein